MRTSCAAAATGGPGQSHRQGEVQGPGAERGVSQCAILRESAIVAALSLSLPQPHGCIVLEHSSVFSVCAFACPWSLPVINPGPFKFKAQTHLGHEAIPRLLVPFPPHIYV